MALSEIGFTRKGKYYVHVDTPYFIDFVAPPVAIGRQPIDEYNELKRWVAEEGQYEKFQTVASIFCPA